jgi:hypothetical protein
MKRVAAVMCPLMLMLMVVGCGPHGERDAGRDGGGGGATDGGGGGTTDGGGAATDGGGSAACPAGDLGAALGRANLLVGGAMEDADFAAAPFGLRYRYLAGAVPTGGPCASCATGCTVNGADCSNAAGCEWWGCWQWDQEPPGRYVANNITADEAAGAVPMFTYYVWLAASGYNEGMAEVTALSDGAVAQAYLADWRFFQQTIAASTSGPVIVHLEPDFWGYGEQAAADPEAIPAAVAAAGAAECAAEPDTMGGFARCMVDVARAEAPNALLGFHASAWGAGYDAYLDNGPGFDRTAHADTTAAWLAALGAGAADLLVVEQSDRDAGFNGRWWDATNATLPDFTMALSWTSRVAGDLGLPLLWWQVPYGHVGLEDICDRYQDNRVDYFFDHPEEYAAAGALGIAFGAGAGCMTTPATDDGWFVMRASTYLAGPGTPLCGP